MIYFITGHPGAGKSQLAVSLALQYLERGCRVASNITLKLDKAMKPHSRVSATKLPYIVDAKFLNQLGFGDVFNDWNESGEPLNAQRDDENYNEEHFGLLLLDETGSWLNSRDWKDKGRRELFAWLTHSRKFGWDVALIVHDEDALDKQIKEALSDIYVTCADLSRVKVPYLPIRLPKVHRATARYRSKTGALFKKWHSTGKKIWPCYNTREAVKAEGFLGEEGFVDMRAPFSMLPAWHLAGRYLPHPPSRSERVWRLVAQCLRVAIGMPLSMALGRSPSAMLSVTDPKPRAALPGLRVSRYVCDKRESYYLARMLSKQRMVGCHPG